MDILLAGLNPFPKLITEDMPLLAGFHDSVDLFPSKSLAIAKRLQEDHIEYDMEDR